MGKSGEQDGASKERLALRNIKSLDNYLPLREVGSSQLGEYEMDANFPGKGKYS